MSVHPVNSCKIVVYAEPTSESKQAPSNNTSQSTLLSVGEKAASPTITSFCRKIISCICWFLHCITCGYFSSKSKEPEAVAKETTKPSQDSPKVQPVDHSPEPGEERVILNAEQKSQLKAIQGEAQVHTDFADQWEAYYEVDNKAWKRERGNIMSMIGKSPKIKIAAAEIPGNLSRIEADIKERRDRWKIIVKDLRDAMIQPGIANGPSNKEMLEDYKKLQAAHSHDQLHGKTGSGRVAKIKSSLAEKVKKGELDEDSLKLFNASYLLAKLEHLYNWINFVRKFTAMSLKR